MHKTDLYNMIADAIDIEEGDFIDVASDLMSIFFYAKRSGIRFDPMAMIKKIIERVGDEGTVIIRAFNFDFCHGVPFDVSHTDSRVGSLGNIARDSGYFRRTKHPMYSWWTIGSMSDVLCSMTNSRSFGKGTPFDLFEKKNCKTVILGNTKNLGLTCLHHIEQEYNVEYRYEKTFWGEYIDEFGIKSHRGYSMFVRRLDRQVLFNEENVKHKLMRTGIMREKTLGGFLRMATVNLPETYELIREDFKNNNIREWTIIK